MEFGLNHIERERFHGEILHISESYGTVTIDYADGSDYALPSSVFYWECMENVRKHMPNYYWKEGEK